MDITTYSNTRPMSVKLALIWLATEGIVTTVSGIWYGPWGMSSYHYIFGFGLILDFAPLWFVFRRKNWARWFVIIYMVFNVCFDPLLGNRFHLTFSTLQKVWFGLSDILDITAVVLLFLPSSNRWFRDRKLPPELNAEAQT